MTRRGTQWGLDSGTLTEVTPCNLMPTAWELDRRMYPARRYAVARHAVLTCYTCPALAWCRTLPPPRHDSVQAATVWWRGRPYTLPEFHQRTDGEA